MDGAGADHHEQARILAVEDVADLLATLEYGFRRRFAERQLFLQGPGVISTSWDSMLRSSNCFWLMSLAMPVISVSTDFRSLAESVAGISLLPG